MWELASQCPEAPLDLPEADPVALLGFVASLQEVYEDSFAAYPEALVGSAYSDALTRESAPVQAALLDPPAVVLVLAWRLAFVPPRHWPLREGRKPKLLRRLCFEKSELTSDEELLKVIPFSSHCYR